MTSKYDQVKGKGWASQRLPESAILSQDVSSYLRFSAVVPAFETEQPAPSGAKCRLF